MICICIVKVFKSNESYEIKIVLTTSKGLMI